MARAELKTKKQDGGVDQFLAGWLYIKHLSGVDAEVLKAILKRAAS